MIADLPPSLYKYFGPDRVGVISDRLLRYTPLGAFNDPFEGRPEVTGLNTPNETISILDGVLQEEVHSVYESLPPEVREVVPFRQVYFLTKGVIQSKQGEIHEALQSVTPLVIDFLTGKIDESLGALCLSEVPDSLLMWAHYGASHAGFVLEFQSDHSHFHEQRSPDDEFRHLRRVFYREARPSSHLTGMGAAELFLVKSGHWAYEREWRIIRALSDANKILDGSPHPVHLFSFPPASTESRHHWSTCNF